MLSSPVLVLNASYEAISITSVRKAIILVMKGVAHVEATSGKVLRAARMSLPQPSVVRLLEYRKIPLRANVLSRRNILVRDRYTCVYCRKKLSNSELTLDHVIPQSRGGGSDWDNLVAACKPCNNRKGSQTPQEAGLTVPKRPKFSIHTARHLVRQVGEDNAIWRPYLFY